MRGYGLAVGIILILVGLAGLAVISTWGWWGMPGPMMDFRRRLPGPAEFRSNGERIYYTAISDSGIPITFSGGPHWFQVHGGSCVDCHGPGGRGDIRVPMTGEVAPDIRYGTLTSEEHDEDEHPLYTEALIRRAITRGLDPNGEPLHWSMPRWQMSDRDLDDLIEYLKTLDGGR